MIKASTIKPIIPIPFLSMVDDPITASTASDKNPPTTGTNLSTANLAVLIVIPSIFVERPYIVRIPINIVKAADIIKVMICRPNSDNFPNSTLLDKLETMETINEKYIRGNITFLIITPTMFTAAKIIG